MGCMIKASQVEPDAELRDFLQGRIIAQDGEGTESVVRVFRDGERPTNGAPTDFLEVVINGGVDVLGADIEYAEGFMMLALYTRLNDDGSVKHRRIKNILTQFDEIIDGAHTNNYFFKIEPDSYIMPPTQDLQSGYSATVLNLRWHTSLDSIS